MIERNGCFQDVPDDVGGLSIGQIADCLKLLSLDQYTQVCLVRVRFQ